MSAAALPIPVSATVERARGFIAAIPEREKRLGLWEIFTERAGIAEFHGGLPRDAAERVAMAQLLAETQTSATLVQRPRDFSIPPERSGHGR
jgi:hypothetical protein